MFFRLVFHMFGSCLLEESLMYPRWSFVKLFLTSDDLFAINAILLGVTCDRMESKTICTFPAESGVVQKSSIDEHGSHGISSLPRRSFRYQWNSPENEKLMQMDIVRLDFSISHIKFWEEMEFYLWNFSLTNLRISGITRLYDSP